MIRNSNTILQAFVASLFTWGVTALGAALVFFLPPTSKKFLDISLGFAAGIMTAASFWSLLAPAIELAEVEMGSFAFFPVAIGFAAGSAFVYVTDRIMPSCVFANMSVVDILSNDVKVADSKAAKSMDGIIDDNISMVKIMESGDSVARVHQTDENGPSANNADGNRSGAATTAIPIVENGNSAADKEQDVITSLSWRRILLLVIAVTVHNFPEGLAVGVAFGSIGKTAKATFESAFALALGIGLQNFPEGLAVSLPLAAFGHSKMRSFFYGQLSGVVEPVGALIGSGAVILMEPVLPYALSFAAGAMIYVVLDDIVPEAQRNGNGRLASISSVIGFLIMMALDVGLG